MFRRSVLVLAAGALLAGTAAVQPAASQELPALLPAKVAVDFGAAKGELLRTERFNTLDNGRVAADAERRPDDVAFYNEQGLHGDIYRIGPDADLCDVATNTCDFSSVDGWFRDVSNASDAVVVHLAPPSIREKRPPAEAKPLLKLLIKGLKERYPRIEYIEFYNEPDVALHCSQARLGRAPILQPEELYQYYVPYYEAVNEVNAELAPAVPLKVGGPTLSGFTEKWMSAFLDGYAADPNPGKRLDFISWHGYGYFEDNCLQFHMFRNDPSEAATQRPALDAMLRERGISTDIPALVTETGIYPGPSFDDPVGKTDYIRQAAGMASLHYWYASQPRTYPFHWVVRHASDERKDQLITRTLDGSVPTRTFSPYGNVMVMQAKMKTTRVAAVSDSLTDGKGVYALASKDGTGATAMIWNYQALGAGSYRATVDMSNLPSSLVGKPVRQTTFRIDQTTSNYWFDSSRADLQVVHEKTFTAGSSQSETIDLQPNALYLIVLEKASKQG